MLQDLVFVHFIIILIAVKLFSASSFPIKIDSIPITTQKRKETELREEGGRVRNGIWPAFQLSFYLKCQAEIVRDWSVSSLNVNDLHQFQSANCGMNIGIFNLKFGRCRDSKMNNKWRFKRIGFSFHILQRHERVRKKKERKRN